MAYAVDRLTKIITIPKADLTLISGTLYELDTEVFRNELHTIQASEEGIAFDDMFQRNAPYTVAGVTYAQSIEVISGYSVTFENGSYSVRLIGSNNNIFDIEGGILNQNLVQVIPNNSAGLVDLNKADIEYTAYNNRVTVDVINGGSGTAHPWGTSRQPVNNLTDAKVIAIARGLSRIYIVGDFTFEASDTLDGYIVSGENSDRSAVILTEAATIQNCFFEDAYITGWLDGGSTIRNCKVGTINCVDGNITDSQLVYNNTITLSGVGANFIRCVSGTPRAVSPTIDLGGSGTILSIRDYNGGIRLINKTGTDKTVLDMSSGHIQIDSTVVNGTITCRGIAKLTDNSTGDAIVASADLLVPARLSNIQHLIENQRSHHTGTGNIWYWDPYGGNDLSDGRSVSTACKTFLHIHDNLVSANNHDIVVCVAGNPAGPTIADEAIVVSKAYTFVRGPGRDFVINPITFPNDCVRIEAEGVEISGFRLDTIAEGSWNGVHISGGDFALIEGIWIGNASDNGISIENSSYTTIEGGYIRGMSGHGVNVSNSVDHLWVKGMGIHGAGGDGIHIEGSGTYEIKIIGDSDIHWCGGYGVSIISSSSLIRLSTEVLIESCGSGAISDPNGKLVLNGKESFNALSDNYPVAKETTTAAIKLKTDTINWLDIDNLGISAFGNYYVVGSELILKDTEGVEIARWNVDPVDNPTTRERV